MTNATYLPWKSGEGYRVGGLSRTSLITEITNRILYRDVEVEITGNEDPPQRVQSIGISALYLSRTGAETQTFIRCWRSDV